jgi:trans-aconitate methyltransferase
VTDSTAAERLRWAVELLDPHPDDRLLEIGCGAGLAVSLVCERLSSGTIVGLDRSKPMIAKAARRNRAHVDAGRAAFQARALADADLGGERFDKAFAVNVRLFRADAGREADVLRRALVPDGALYLVQQHPSAARTRAVTDELTTALARHGFTVRDVLARGEGASAMTCVVAA